MAIVTNTIQGVGQPTRGTSLSSLGSTGIVLAANDTGVTVRNTLVVPFGTRVILNLVAESTSNTALSGLQIWGRAFTVADNPSRHWPVDYVTGTGMGPGDRELWVPLGAVTVPAPNLQYEGGAYVGLSVEVDLQGVEEIAAPEATPAAGTVLMARFAS